MANIGRVYERLFRRDYGYRPASRFIYIPRFYKVAPGFATPFPGITLQSGVFKTAEGVVDDVDGSVTYHLNMPNPVTPGAALRLRYYLTYDPTFAQAETWLSVNGTDKVWTHTQTILNNFPFILTNSQAHYVPPYTGPVTAWFHSWAPWRWTD